MADAHAQESQAASKLADSHDDLLSKLSSFVNVPASPYEPLDDDPIARLKSENDVLKHAMDLMIRSRRLLGVISPVAEAIAPPPAPASPPTPPAAPPPKV